MCIRCDMDEDEGRCPRCGSLPTGLTPRVGTVCGICRAIEREAKAGRERGIPQR